MGEKCPSGGIRRRSSTRTPLWLRLPQQLLELVDDHLGELAAGVIAMRLRAGIVQFHLIGEKAAVRRAFASRSAMISVHSWNLFDDLRIVIANAAVQKNRRGQFQRARAKLRVVCRRRKNCYFQKRCGSYVEP
jgi:hypothetical protein